VRSKREIVLVGAVVVAAAYGIYSYAFAPKRTAGATAAAMSSAPATVASATVREITEIQREIGRTAVSPLARLVVARAGEEWNPALFLWAPLPGELMERDARRQQEQQAAQAALLDAAAKRQAAEAQERQQATERQRRFSYTGYVCSAGRTYAVINNVVYAVGDRLAGADDCSLQAVTPENIVIEDHGRAITIQVPLRQDSTRKRLEAGQGGKP
jgi:hypothetical protein